MFKQTIFASLFISSVALAEPLTTSFLNSIGPNDCTDCSSFPDGDATTWDIVPESAYIFYSEPAAVSYGKNVFIGTNTVDYTVPVDSTVNVEIHMSTDGGETFSTHKRFYDFFTGPVPFQFSSDPTLTKIGQRVFFGGVALNEGKCNVPNSMFVTQYYNGSWGPVNYVRQGSDGLKDRPWLIGDQKPPYRLWALYNFYRDTPGGPNNCPDYGTPLFHTSLDFGQTWSPAHSLTQPDVVNVLFTGVFGAAGDNDSLLFPFIANIGSPPTASLRVVRLFPNGFNTQILLTVPVIPLDDDQYHLDLMPHTRFNSMPSLWSDGKGRILVAWTQLVADKTQIFYTASMNNGQTWTTPTFVRATGNDQVLPVFAWKKNGAGDLCYYQRLFSNENYMLFVCNPIQNTTIGEAYAIGNIFRLDGEEGSFVHDFIGDYIAFDGLWAAFTQGTPGPFRGLMQPFVKIVKMSSCTIVDPHQSTNGWWLILPAIVLITLRKHNN